MNPRNHLKIIDDNTLSGINEKKKITKKNIPFLSSDLIRSHGPTEKSYCSLTTVLPMAFLR